MIFYQQQTMYQVPNTPHKCRTIWYSHFDIFLLASQMPNKCVVAHFSH